MKHVLLLDNFDSFTHNLAQALGEAGAKVCIRRNDSLDVDEVEQLDPSHVVISPGPGRPEDAGATEAIVRANLGRRPLLGVCLGHQALVRVLGGTIGHAPAPVHGKSSRIQHDGDGLYAGIASPMEVGRYHSLAATQLPSTLQVTATSEDGAVMSVQHRTAYAFGVQFHPESLLTPQGGRLLANFLRPRVQITDETERYHRDPSFQQAVHGLYTQVLRGDPAFGMKNTTSLFVARIGGQLVGFKAGTRAGLTFESTSGAVRPGYRRLGVASALMRAQHDALRNLLRDGGVIKTSTLNVFRPMLLLDLAHGFRIADVQTTGGMKRVPYLRLVRRLGWPARVGREDRLTDRVCSIDPRFTDRLRELIAQGYDVVGERHTEHGPHLLLERFDESPFGPETYEDP